MWHTVFLPEYHFYSKIAGRIYKHWVQIIFMIQNLCSKTIFFSSWGQAGTDGASIKFNQSPSRVPTFDFQVPVPVPSPHFSILSPRPCPQSPLLNFVSPALSPSPRLCPHPCPQIFKFPVPVPVPWRGSGGSQSPMPTSDLYPFACSVSKSDFSQTWYS